MNIGYFLAEEEEREKRAAAARFLASPQTLREQLAEVDRQKLRSRRSLTSTRTTTRRCGRFGETLSICTEGTTSYANS
jgi:hypothetical protein